MKHTRKFDRSRHLLRLAAQAEASPERTEGIFFCAHDGIWFLPRIGPMRKITREQTDTIAKALTAVKYTFTSYGGAPGGGKMYAQQARMVADHQPVKLYGGARNPGRRYPDLGIVPTRPARFERIWLNEAEQIPYGLLRSIMLRDGGV